MIKQSLAEPARDARAACTCPAGMKEARRVSNPTSVDPIPQCSGSHSVGMSSAPSSLAWTLFLKRSPRAFGIARAWSSGAGSPECAVGGLRARRVG